jgi:hypothetical protein
MWGESTSTTVIGMTDFRSVSAWFQMSYFADCVGNKLDARVTRPPLPDLRRIPDSRKRHFSWEVELKLAPNNSVFHLFAPR